MANKRKTLSPKLKAKVALEAVKVAAEDYRKALTQEQPIDVVLFSEAWKTWGPFPGTPTESVSFHPQKAKVQAGLLALQKAHQEALDARIAELRAQFPTHPELANEAGILLVYQGRYGEFAKLAHSSWLAQDNQAMELLM
ncbi:MAG TPA: hypothetical protein VLM37_13070 [Fibrobacteraceae bacterium]|nr:hypothetical protein [Fibrobacteraceae bacterium]